MRSPEHGRRREAGFAVADEAGRRQRRRIPGSPAVPPSSSLSLPLSDGADSRWAPRVSPFFSSRATPPFYAPFPPARPFPAPSPPARIAFSRVRRPSDALASEATPYARKPWRARRLNWKIAQTPRRRLGDA